jgi:ribonuclease-3 family protein
MRPIIPRVFIFRFWMRPRYAIIYKVEDNDVKTAYGISLGALPENRVREFPVLNLAYIGDTVFDLYIRSYLVKNNMGRVEQLHSLASGVVNARSQAKAADLLEGMFTERETDVYRAGRNAKSAPPKNMSREDYSRATGLEAVIGYLYLLGSEHRLDELFGVIVNHFFGGK